LRGDGAGCLSAALRYRFPACVAAQAQAQTQAIDKVGGMQASRSPDPRRRLRATVISRGWTMATRCERIECDLLVVGGGINGAAIARDAAGRGLRVVLCEKDDLGQHTSSASSKLIHGGLRYLEHFEFGLVRKALAEREVLLRSAPHVTRALRFVMPLDAGQRPAWLIRAGLFVYDHLARRTFLPGSHSIDLAAHPAGAPLRRTFTHAFAYSDGWVDDARLVILNALDARERGATILPRTLCGPVQRHRAHWTATLAHAQGSTLVEARCLVNATGPWAARFLHDAAGAPARHALRLSKGSHIVVPRLFAHPDAYVFQHPDRRIVFALPYEDEFTLIGTTDIDYRGDLDAVAITPDETAYLCQLVNRYFSRQISPADVVWSFAGVRPLLADAAGSAADTTRDFRLETDTAGAPLLSVIGGKITTSRKLAEQALDWIAPALGRRARAWTANACLPGGDLFGEGPSARGVLEFERWLAGQQRRYAWLEPALLRRYARAYGTRIEAMLSDCRSSADLGAQLAPGLYEVEAAYLLAQEWAACADDILWRRSKLGLHLPPGRATGLDAWIGARQPVAAP
jgi:glycerol-3-phosphate dehydrogenase